MSVAVMKRKAAYGKYHPTFADFRAAIQNVLVDRRILDLAGIPI